MNPFRILVIPIFLFAVVLVLITVPASKRPKDLVFVPNDEPGRPITSMERKTEPQLGPVLAPAYRGR